MAASLQNGIPTEVGVSSDFMAVCPPAPTLIAPPPEVLNDGVVTLRRWRISDADMLFAAITVSRPRLAEWMPWARNETYEREEAVGFLKRTTTKWEDNTEWNYAITITQGGGLEEILGSCGLMRRDDHPGLDIGYWLANGYTGYGYATAAAKLLTAQGLEMNAPSVRILHDKKNTRSGAVPRRLGFECEGEIETDGSLDVAWVKYPEPMPEE
ncbi:hypothetical protein NQ176_g7350 [Zarea fungicola]|uniref:Uncharacterized protein n=1 Tax=Zarea fungicola TaxID=93591 RepID=A0ACC1MZ23_9HYPO|nr:hypothetical protein NQ176_g7350 [Lecanicillium fungicola]